MKITKQQLYAFLLAASCSDDKKGPCKLELDDVYDVGDMPDEVWNRLSQAFKDKDLRNICVGSGMSENHPGGDDFVDLANRILEAIKDGFTVVTWYGDDTECLIAGVSGSIAQEICK